MMRKKIPQRGTDPSKSYVVSPADNSILAYLNETLKVLEMRFSNFDQDGAGSLSFEELECELSMVGFMGGDNLEQSFKRVDRDHNGTLDFAEFLELLFLFVMGDGDLSGVFMSEVNALFIKTTFQRLDKLLRKYDSDNSLQMNYAELVQFFDTEFHDIYASGLFQRTVDVEYPVHQRNHEITFAKVMHIIYIICCNIPGTTVKGVYRNRVTPFVPGQVSDKTAKWNLLRDFFTTLENDFKSLDKNGDRLVQKDEITQGIPLTKCKEERVVIISALQNCFMQCDDDDSGSLDFYEFMFLGMIFSMKFAYQDLVSTSTGAAIVKRSFLDICAVFKQFDADKNNRLTLDELQQFFKLMFGEMPKGADAAWNVCKKKSASVNEDCLNYVGFLKLLYMVTLPDGVFHPSKYNPAKIQTKPTVLTQATAVATSHQPRIQNVQVALFKKTKLLGQGGQGCVYMGSYNNIPCAAKTFLGTPSPALVQELLDEVSFFMKLDHPNCHYLLGAKTTLGDGGLLELTEVCDNGSLFDMYNTKGKRFDKKTSLRLARECASGFEEIHRIGYMHRDIKSLNVFVDKNLVAKVADFGMCTNLPSSTDGCGTAQWAAPEVLHCMVVGPKPYDKRCDYYSYAILLWELFHYKIPYSDKPYGSDQMKIARNVIAADVRPTLFPGVCPNEITNIIKRCWDKNPANRLNFTQIVAALDVAKPSCQ